MNTIIIAIIIYIISILGNIYFIYESLPKNSTIGDIFKNPIDVIIMLLPCINTISIIILLIIFIKEIKIK